MPQLGLIQNEIRSFLGVNLRQDRLDLADEQLAKAINADLHTVVGSMLLRLGRTKQNTSALSATTVRRLSKINNNSTTTTRYRVATQTLFRDTTAIDTGLSTNNITTIVPFRPQGDTVTWAFVGDDSDMQKDDGTSLVSWGITAPSAAPTVALGSGTGLTGTYSFKYTFARVVGSTVVTESNPSAASADVVPANQDIDLSAIASTSTGGATHVRIYRTAAGGTTYLFDQQIALGTTTATSSQADAALGAAVETDNDTPPVGSWIDEHNGHIFISRIAANPDRLYWTKRYIPEAVPSTNFLQIGTASDEIQCHVPIAGILGVFTRKTKYRVIGNSTSGFTAVEAISKRGTGACNATIATERGIIFPARDGIYVTNLVTADTFLSGDIMNLFFGDAVNDMQPIDWTYEKTFAAAVYKNRYYFSYAETGQTTPNRTAVYSFETGRWYFYDTPAHSFYVEEDSDNLTAGHTDGFVYLYENGSDDAGTDISMEVQTKDYFGESTTTRKQFQYFKVDADTSSATVTFEFYVDGNLKQTTTLATSGRTSKALQNLPEGSVGYTWRCRITYTGSTRVKIYGITAIYLSLDAA